MHRGPTRGFTLVEILGVVVIVAVLAAIAVSRLGGARERAVIAAVTADLRNLATEQEHHRERTGSYARSVSSLTDLSVSDGVTITITLVDDGRGWAAVAEHAGVPGVRCGLFAGTADAASARPASVAGAVGCGSNAQLPPAVPEDPDELEGDEAPITIQEPGSQPPGPPS